MDKTKWPAIGGLIAGTILLTRNVPTTFAFEKPIHTSIALLASSAATVIGLSRLLPKSSGWSLKGQHYDAVPLEEVRQPHGSRQASPRPEDVRYSSSLRKLRILFLVLVVAICLRVETLREILDNVQCTTLSWEPLLPLAFALWDYLTVQRHKKRAASEDENDSVYDVMEQSLIRTRYGYLFAAGLVSLGGMLALATTSSPTSTHICAASLPHHWQIPLLQVSGTALDIMILYCVEQLLHQHEGRGPRSMSLRFMSVGWAFLFSAIILLVIGIVYYTVTERDRTWILSIPRLYFWSTVNLNILVCFTVASALFTIYHVGVVTTSLIAAFVCISAATTSYAWRNPHPFPPTQPGLAFVAICLVIFGFATYFHIETVTEEQGSARMTFSRVPSWFYLFMLSLFFVRAGLWLSRSNSVTYHPIDMLLYDAQSAHEAYVNQTSASQNLTAAVYAYRNRYNRHPPPGFQHWYKYATARNSVVIDDYDSIYRDLLPFYALTPAEIRQRTWDMVSNPWNDAAGISVRDGEVAISPNVVPTHRWMLDGIVEMISHFAEWLPDMDLAFNLNDECRIAVPYEKVEPMRQVGRGWGGIKDRPRNAFGEMRGEQWQIIPDQPNLETPLKELSFQRTFYEFGSVGCQPRSPARSQRVWDVSGLCTSCTAPQSLGAFLANWTVAADICHQPDLANLHGLYLSPAAFKGAHDLYPVFSQSKAHGFNDILYPSAWNYIDKAKYDPNEEHPDKFFPEKNNTLFWRGATSEGVSPGMGQWRGMTRQRFVHLANNINGSEPPQPLLLPSLPSNNAAQKLTYTSTPISTLTTLLSTSIHIVDFIARCGGRDCPHQATEFAPLYPPSDFQDHWQYKYLLDLDGAGFSGRFLPFLYSHSLPFKAALFREWWDDRVTPWQHFVPLDVRGHGLWATLAYFAGLEGRVNGREVRVEAHERAGARIAEKGRDWAMQVLRKEDMEIYFFRLLLEWGRLTDDGRDEIGFDVDAG